MASNYVLIHIWSKVIRKKLPFFDEEKTPWTVRIIITLLLSTSLLVIKLLWLKCATVSIAS